MTTTLTTQANTFHVGDLAQLVRPLSTELVEIVSVSANGNQVRAAGDNGRAPLYTRRGRTSDFILAGEHGHGAPRLVAVA